MLIDLLIQINESRSLLLKHSFLMSCPELILFKIRLMEFRNSSNGAQEKLFVGIIQDFLLTDSVHELNLRYDQKHSIRAYNIDEFNIIEREVDSMITQTLIPTLEEFIKKEYATPKASPVLQQNRRPSIIDIFK